ncbi:MAG: peptide chain release factor N(5)-glutamine methyltransferase [Verrucomicrobiales bacterium]|nr:peptide chain release factor N(5)-glutamine methyltransferase [Verrucomicrobiales bacterium]
MPTVLDTLQKGTDFLEKHGVEEARLNMQHLIAHTLKCDRMQLYVDFDRPLEEPDLEKLRGLTKRRANGEPLQHLLGTVEFCDLTFKTDERALVPRPETEELVSKLLKVKSWPNPCRILDMGCGSGVIGLALAKKIDGAQVTLADLSPEALALAGENAAVLELEPTMTESDLFSAIEGTFDLIVANLPYIPEAEITALSREVQNDPVTALAGGESGLEIMERFLAEAPGHLSENGKIAMEFGIDQADALVKLADHSGFSDIKVAADLGGIDRFLFAVKSNGSN